MEKKDREQHDNFLRLFLEHEEALRLFVRSMLFSLEESREVMQEVAIVLWRKFDDAMDSNEFRRWAFGVARMEALAFRRDRARDRHTFGNDIAQLLEHAVQAKSASLERERSALDKCVRKLPDDQRELVGIAYEPGVKKYDLARRLGLTPMALYKKLHRIRLRLMACAQRELASEGAS